MIRTISELESSFGDTPSNYKSLSNSAFSIVCIEYLVTVGAAVLYQMQQKWECNQARHSTVELER